MFLRKILFLLFFVMATPVFAQTDWRNDPDSLLCLPMDETSGDLIDQCGTYNGDMDGIGENLPPDRTSGRFFGALEFKISNGFVDFGDIDVFDGRNHLTWAMWLNMTEDQSNAEHEIVRKDGSFNMQDSAGVQRVYSWTSADPFGVSFNIAGDSYPTDYYFDESGNWVHYMITYDGTTIKAYRNCTLVASQAKTGTFSNTVNPLSLGRRGLTEGSGPKYVYVGKMDDLLVSARALNTTECTELMTWGIDGSGGFNPAQGKTFNTKFFNGTQGGNAN